MPYFAHLSLFDYSSLYSGSAPVGISAMFTNANAVVHGFDYPTSLINSFKTSCSTQAVFHPGSRFFPPVQSALELLSRSSPQRLFRSLSR